MEGGREGGREGFLFSRFASIENFGSCYTVLVLHASFQSYTFTSMGQKKLGS